MFLVVSNWHPVGPFMRKFEECVVCSVVCSHLAKVADGIQKVLGGGPVKEICLFSFIWSSSVEEKPVSRIAGPLETG